MAARLHPQDGEPRLALDEGEDIPLPMSALEHHQVALPMPKGRSLADLSWALCPCAFGRDEQTALTAGVAFATLPATSGQQPTELVGPVAIDELIDRLVTDTALAVGVELQPASDLLRRPSFLQPVDDVAGQRCILMELAASNASTTRCRVGALGEIAPQPRTVVKPVSPDLPMDRRAVPPKAPGWKISFRSGRVMCS
jgi:hypothetical protein